MPHVYPGRIDNVDHLESLLSEPTPHAIETLAKLDGDLILLGVAGKMGPTLARMAQRAFEAAGVTRRVIGVARFSEPGSEDRLKAMGIETIRCDLLDPAQVARLPEVRNVLAMFGMKFGSTGQESRTWAMNALAPAYVCERYRQSRIVAFSTGNVYGLTPVALGGSRETDSLTPTGEYAMSCVGRERIYEHHSRTCNIPMALLRLNYATEMRYGVMVDIATKVWNGETIDLSMGHFNAIWQADANAAALSAFAYLANPPTIWNLAGPETLSVQRVAEEFGTILGKPAHFKGTESADAFLSNAQLSHRLLGYPRASAAQMIAWIADWVSRGGATLGKPTHFEDRKGKY